MFLKVYVKNCVVLVTTPGIKRVSQWLVFIAANIAQARIKFYFLQQLQ